MVNTILDSVFNTVTGGGITPAVFLLCVAVSLVIGLILCGLGPRILRCETAPIFALACLSFRWELGGR